VRADLDGLNVDYVTVPASWGARDQGKVFRIKEWPARRAEEWAWGLAFALKGTQGEIPEDVARLGMAGIGVSLLNTVLKADVSYDRLKPFMNELIDECVTIVRDPKNRDKATGEPVASELMPNDLMEVKTIQWLRSEVVRLHTNFSVLDALSALISAARNGLPAS
jgi:hypothetical protein